MKNHRPERSIAEVLKDKNGCLMSLPGVVGTGIGECDGKPCIKVLVIQRTEGLVKRIPPVLDGFKVVIEETGEIRPLDHE